MNIILEEFKNYKQQLIWNGHCLLVLGSFMYNMFVLSSKCTVSPLCALHFVSLEEF